MTLPLACGNLPVTAWLADLDCEAASGLTRACAPAEIARAARRPTRLQARRYLCHRGWLRQLLGRHLGIPPAEVVVLTTDAGRPYLADSTLQITVSHSRGLGLYALCAEGEIGADVQWRDSALDWPAVLRVFATPAESASVWTATSRSGSAAFFDWWCRKEAVLKGRGTGFRAPFSSVPVAPPPADTAVRTRDGEVWHCCDLATPVGYSAALAWNRRRCRPA